MAKVKFEMLGEPKAKGRPRFVKGRTYTPKDTVYFENLVKTHYQDQSDDAYFTEQIKVTVDAWFKIPKSVSKKKMELMERGKIRPTKKPDCDNLLKSICDSLNLVAYDDDKQIVEVTLRKWYTHRPRTVVTIEDV